MWWYRGGIARRYPQMTSEDAMTQPSQDLEHLRLLSIFHYVVAALAAFFSLFPLLYMGIGVAIVMKVQSVDRADPAGVLMGWFMILFSAAFVLMGLQFLL